jgi:deoxyribodipyrimidine photolyase
LCVRYAKGGLRAYAARRNDCLAVNGVSRLSAHHHFGCISPFALAADCSGGAGGAAAAKWLDEFQVRPCG